MQDVLAHILAYIRLNVILYWLLTTVLTAFYIWIVKGTPCAVAIVSCLVLALTFVGSLYVWKATEHRDHPSTIKRRCLSVTFTTLWSPLFVYFCLDHDIIGGNITFWQLLGFRTEGFLAAVTLPLMLTMVLFAGPLVMRILDGVYSDRTYWSSNCCNLVWWRNHLVAPFSEEFSFRTCMLPLLVQCLSHRASIIICPLFFGVAHVHHLIDKFRVGCNVKRAILETTFQFAYTTVFGVYSAFLFLRTGHFVAPFVVHSFCNHMGFPDFGEVFSYAQPKRSLITLVFVLGLFAWSVLLFPVTDPHLYRNFVYGS